MELDCKTFELDGELVPSVAELMSAADPATHEQMLKQAGFTRAAQNHGPKLKAAKAGTQFQELSEEDRQLYSSYLSQSSRPEDCPIEPPPQALPALTKARGNGLFDQLTVRYHPQTGESLVLGSVSDGVRTHYYRVAQWAADKPCVTLDELRKQKKVSRAIGRALKSILEWRPNIHLDLTRRPRDKSRTWLQVAWFSLVTLAAAAGSWFVLYLTDSWWLFAGVSVAAMIVCGIYSEIVKDKQVAKAVGLAVGWIIGLDMLATAVAGPWHWIVWNTAPRTEDVLVCRVFTTYDAPTDWRLITSSGHKTVEAGFYDGVYYDQSSEKAAKSLVGKWVRITEHGHIGMDGNPPYVTAATTLREGSGNCGK